LYGLVRRAFRLDGRKGRKGGGERQWSLGGWKKSLDLYDRKTARVGVNY